MTEKHPKPPAASSSPKGKTASKTPDKAPDKAAGSSPESAKVDRPGFDLGGATGKTTAGTGLGLGPDAAENRSDRSLPGRRGKRS